MWNFGLLEITYINYHSPCPSDNVIYHIHKIASLASFVNPSFRIFSSYHIAYDCLLIPTFIAGFAWRRSWGVQVRWHEHHGVPSRGPWRTGSEEHRQRLEHRAGRKKQKGVRDSTHLQGIKLYYSVSRCSFLRIRFMPQLLLGSGRKVI